MSNLNIIRAWKAEEYRPSLSEAERVLLPAHPAGLIELADAELDAVAGGREICPNQIIIRDGWRIIGCAPRENFDFGPG
jgi:mersacidin/lichenicidin family type 2 lantibiotic